MRGHHDLRLVATAAALCAAGSLIVPLGPVRAIFAVPLVLVLPGYAITAAVLGRRSLVSNEMLPLSVGISLSATVLSSVVLNFMPGGLQAIPWAVLLLLIVLLGCRCAANRRDPADASVLRIPSPKPAAALCLIGGAALIVAALVLAQTTLHAPRAFGYTQLWMTPADAVDNRTRIGVISQQQHSIAYRLEVRLSGRAEPIVRSFTLSPGQARTLRIAPRSQRAIKVEASLFKRGKPNAVYRQIWGWTRATQGLRQ